MRRKRSTLTHTNRSTLYVLYLLAVLSISNAALSRMPTRGTYRWRTLLWKSWTYDKHLLRSLLIKFPVADPEYYVCVPGLCIPSCSTTVVVNAASNIPHTLYIPTHKYVRVYPAPLCIYLALFVAWISKYKKHLANNNWNLSAEKVYLEYWFTGINVA